MPAQNDAATQETDADFGIDEGGQLGPVTSPGIMTAASESAASESAASESAMEAAHGGDGVNLVLTAAEERDQTEAALPESEEGVVLPPMETAAEEASESEIAETDTQATELKLAADEDAAQQEGAAYAGPEGTQEEGEGSPEEPAAVEANGDP